MNMFWKYKKNELALAAEMEKKRLEFEKKQLALTLASQFLPYVDNKPSRYIVVAKDIENYLNNR